MITFPQRFFSIIMAVLIIAGMMVFPGVTVFAGGTETEIVPVDEPKVEINGLSLVLNGDIGLSYHVFVPSDFKSGYMVLEFMDEQPINVNIKDCSRDGNGRYIATYYLSAIELSESVKITVFDKDGKELAQKSKSAEEYANILINDKKATEQEKNIAKTLINYGHYAQLTCSDANGWIIGSDYAETSAFYPPTANDNVFDIYAPKWQGNADDFKKIAIALWLDYRTGITFYISDDEEPDVTVNGEEYTVQKCERGKYNYSVKIDGVNALNLEDEYEVKINDVTVTLCAFGYCNLAVQRNTNENTVNAVKALYEFYEAVKNYNQKR